MAKDEQRRGFDDLINTTSQAFDASVGGQTEIPGVSIPRMVNNRQSVYKVPLIMVRPDRFQARYILPHAIRQTFYSGEIEWGEATRRWIDMANNDPNMKHELEELAILGDSLHDIGQIKPVTGQVVNENGRDVFRMLTGERRFWATAIKAIRDDTKEEPFVLAIIDNQPSLEKQIAENMAYKALTAVGKARAAARIVLESNGITPLPNEDEYDYFRQVSEVRLNDETRDKLQETLQLERTYFGRLMKFFELPEELMEICDRAEMPERVLREIMQYDRIYWEQGVRYYAVHEGCSYLDVHVYLDNLAGRIKNRAVRTPLDPATKSARSIRRALFAIEDIPQEDKVGALADAILGDVDPDQANSLLRSIGELQQALTIRVSNLKR
jgi:hypothetical protein